MSVRKMEEQCKSNTAATTLIDIFPSFSELHRPKGADSLTDSALHGIWSRARPLSWAKSLGPKASGLWFSFAEGAKYKTNRKCS